jgi:hypothetical protein
MDGNAPTVLERMAACLPCASWPCGSGRCGGGGSSGWQLWPGDFDDDAQPILTAPTPALAECLIPPSVTTLCADQGDASVAPSGTSWDIGAGRALLGQVRYGNVAGPFLVQYGQHEHLCTSIPLSIPFVQSGNMLIVSKGHLHAGKRQNSLQSGAAGHPHTALFICIALHCVVAACIEEAMQPVLCIAIHA